MLRPRISAFLAATLVVGLASGSVAAPAVAPRVPDPYYPLDGNAGYDVLRYDIRDSYRLGDGRLSGSTTIRLAPLEDLTTFSLDLLLNPTAVEVDGAAVDYEKTNRHELVDHPAPSVGGGRPITVLVRYHGYPSRISWQGERGLARQRPRGRHDGRAAHGGLVVPEQRPPQRQGAVRHPDHDREGP